MGAGCRSVLRANPERQSRACDIAPGGCRRRYTPRSRCTRPWSSRSVDGWNERSIARCTYRVGPPEGRNYTSRPVNAREAEQRRLERFQVSDPAPGPRTAPKEETNPIFPMTLDLRLPASGPETHENSGLVP